MLGVQCTFDNARRAGESRPVISVHREASATGPLPARSCTKSGGKSPRSKFVSPFQLILLPRSPELSEFSEGQLGAVVPPECRQVHFWSGHMPCGLWEPGRDAQIHVFFLPDGQKNLCLNLPSSTLNVVNALCSLPKCQRLRVRPPLCVNFSQRPRGAICPRSIWCKQSFGAFLLAGGVSWVGFIARALIY